MLTNYQKKYSKDSEEAITRVNEKIFLIGEARKFFFSKNNSTLNPSLRKVSNNLLRCKRSLERDVDMETEDIRGVNDSIKSNLKEEAQSKKSLDGDTGIEIEVISKEDINDLIKSNLKKEAQNKNGLDESSLTSDNRGFLQKFFDRFKSKKQTKADALNQQLDAAKKAFAVENSLINSGDLVLSSTVQMEAFFESCQKQSQLAALEDMMQNDQSSHVIDKISQHLTNMTNPLQNNRRGKLETLYPNIANKVRNKEAVNMKQEQQSTNQSSQDQGVKRSFLSIIADYLNPFSSIKEPVNTVENKEALRNSERIIDEKEGRASDRTIDDPNTPSTSPYSPSADQFTAQYQENFVIR